MSHFKISILVSHICECLFFMVHLWMLLYCHIHECFFAVSLSWMFPSCHIYALTLYHIYECFLTMSHLWMPPYCHSHECFFTMSHPCMLSHNLLCQIHECSISMSHLVMNDIDNIIIFTQEQSLVTEMLTLKIAYFCPSLLFLFCAEMWRFLN